MKSWVICVKVKVHVIAGFEQFLQGSPPSLLNTQNILESYIVSWQQGDISLGLFFFFQTFENKLPAA